MKRFWKWSLMLLALGIAISGLTGAPASANVVAQQTYQAIDLGTLGGQWSGVNAVNEWDEAVGSSQTADGRTHAYRWRGGVMTDLGVLESGPGEFAVATDINDFGQVVGVSQVGGFLHGFLWDDGVMTDLGNLGAFDTVPWAINNRSQVVGYSFLPGGGESHAFLWERGVMTDLDASNASDINDWGQVIGDNAFAGYRTYRWQRGRLTDLGIDSVAAINNRGWVAGSVTYDWTHGVLWRSGVVTDLGTLGGSWTQVSAVNDVGQVIGVSETAAGETHAFMWQDESMIDLATRGIALATMSDGLADINNRGHIVGVVFLAPTWDPHAFLFR